MPKKEPEATESKETPEEAAKRIPSKDEPEVLEDGFPNPAAMDVWDYQVALTSEQWRHGRI